MSRVVLEGVKKTYGPVTALESLDLSIQEGEFLTLLGPSGCGKTTTLRLIAGFITPSSGRILLGDEDVTPIPPQHRRIGMVFQDYALFPHLTISENIAFGLVERGVSRGNIARRVGELLRLIQLPDVGDRYPGEVNGGQQQRIAVARAVAYPPKVLLMDEPLGALDLKLRESMQIELRRLQQELGITTVYVTHDQTEAMSMSDRIVVMNRGRIEQMGSAEEIYNFPRSRFVADFVGQVNVLEGRVADVSGGNAVCMDFKGHPVQVDLSRRPGARVGDPLIIAIRPEFVRIVPVGEVVANGTNALAGRLISSHFAGNLVKYEIHLADDSRLRAECRPRERIPAIGSEVQICWSPEDAVILSDDVASGPGGGG